MKEYTLKYKNRNCIKNLFNKKKIIKSVQEKLNQLQRKYIKEQ